MRLPTNSRGIAASCAVCRLNFEDVRLAVPSLLLPCPLLAARDARRETGRYLSYARNKCSDFVTDALSNFVDLLSNGYPVEVRAARNSLDFSSLRALDSSSIGRDYRTLGMQDSSFSLSLSRGERKRFRWLRCCTPCLLFVYKEQIDFLLPPQK